MILKYLNYVMRHKWFVFLECCKLGVPWRGITHDLSKIRLSEFIPYMNYFYGGYPEEISAGLKYSFPDAKTKAIVKEEFDFAWLLHLKRNPHHYQYWILNEDDGGIKTLEMPEKYIREMIADWRGAGKAIHGKDDLTEWFKSNRHNIESRMHPDSFKKVLEIIGEEN